MAEEAVLKYLITTNRPYSTNDIMLNLHKQWGKTAIQKALDSLVLSSAVIEKIYGKQKVYCIKQSDEDVASLEELKVMDDKIEELTTVLKDYENKIKIGEAELSTLKSSMTTVQMQKEIESLKIKIDEITKQLDELSSKNVNPVSEEEFKNVKEEEAKIIKEYKLRKRICMDIINAILETYPKTKKELLEELGIETDEDANFSL